MGLRSFVVRGVTLHRLVACFVVWGVTLHRLVDCFVVWGVMLHRLVACFVAWGVKLHRLVASYKYCGTAYRSNLEGLSGSADEYGTDRLSQNVSSQL